MGRTSLHSLNVRFIAVLWAVYYLCVFTVGRFEQWTQHIIWVGGGVVVTWTLFAKGFKPRDITSEVLFIVAFLGWSLLGGVAAQDSKAYGNYFKLCVEMLAVVAFVGAIVRKSGASNIFWWTFIVVAIFNTAAIAMSGAFQISGEYGHVERAKGLTGNANSLAFLCFMGILGTLALVGEKKTSLSVKAVAIGGAVMAFWGIIASGSRGSYLISMLAAILWPLMCLGSKRHKWRLVLVVLIMAIAMRYVSLWVQGSTSLGARIEKTVEGEESSASVRQNLILIGLGIAKEHPLIGVGLGQFALVSGTGYSTSHNEWAELLVTTGIPGFLFFMSVYISAWRRLTRVLKYINDPILRYRVNFARMTLIILLVSGALFRPNFISISTMFLIALVVGISHWAEDTVRRSWHSAGTAPFSRRET